jgi:O-antigen ligase
VAGVVIGSVYLLFFDPTALVAKRLTIGFEDENANDPNTFARIQAIGLIGTGYLWWRLGRHPMLRLALLPLAGLIILTIFNSGSRGCLVSLMFAGCALIVSMRCGGLARRVVGLVVVFMIVGFTMLWGGRMGLFSPLAVDRFKTILNMSEEDIQRVPIWWVGAKMAMHNPVFGVGYMQFQRGYLRYTTIEDGPNPRSPHSAYVGMAAELGIPGLAVFLWLLYRLLKRARAVPWSFLNGLMSASVALIVVTSITDHYHYKKGMYLLYALVLTTSIYYSQYGPPGFLGHGFSIKNRDHR